MLSEIGLHPDDQFDWYILDSNSIQIEKGQNESLGNFIFNNPGSYTIHINNISNSSHKGCEHEIMKEIIQPIHVSSYAIRFNMEQISFSSTLSASNLSSGLEMTIPIEVTSVPGSMIHINTNELIARFQGVDCSIQSKLMNANIIDKNGQYSIQYHLQGTVTPNSYIMIDFIEPYGKISTYYHTTKL